MAQACECGDSKCPAHYGSESCTSDGTVLLRRVDMGDNDTMFFCEACAADALSCGCFDVVDEDEDDGIGCDEV